MRTGRLKSGLFERSASPSLLPNQPNHKDMSTKQKLQGKVAVITGGNSGIGLATAKRFVAEGAYVFITGRRQTELDGAVKSIGENVTGIQGDVAKLADLDRIYSTVRKQKGRLDVLFANAGGGSLVPLDRSLRNTSIRSLTPTYAVCFSQCKKRFR